MIVYDLSCDQAHRFEGWFASADDFDAQVNDEQIACPVCGSVSVSRQLSAPHVNTGNATSAKPPHPQQTAVSGVSFDQMRRKFVEFVLNNTEDVGRSFPEEARKIHYEEEPKRPIRGQASRDEIQELHEEGVQIFPLPQLPDPPDQLH
jgi:hypothetical protein